MGKQLIIWFLTTILKFSQIYGAHRTTGALTTNFGDVSFVVTPATPGPTKPTTTTPVPTTTTPTPMPTPDPYPGYKTYYMPNIISPESHECFNSSDYGKGYRGNISSSITGLACLPWTATTDPYFTSVNFPHSGLHGGSFCRNPAADFNSPWCFVLDPNHGIIRQQCEIPICDGAKTKCYHGTGDGYKGHKSTTISGRTCQNWTSQYPHKHNFDIDGSKNYCRNPTGFGAPWCFTTDVNTRWEYCEPNDCNRSATTPQVICRVGPWSTYSPCSLANAITAADGTKVASQTRTRKILTFGNFTLQDCPDTTTSQTRICNA